jgi:hypothetical protein
MQDIGAGAWGALPREKLGRDRNIGGVAGL